MEEEDDAIEDETTTFVVQAAAAPAAAPASKSFFVYMLESSVSRATYVGATVDVNHRLRQHNGELAGGAHATTMRVKAGETWRRVCYVSGFPDWPAALQFEWRWKQLSRKLLPSPKGKKGSRPVVGGSLSRPVVDGGSLSRPNVDGGSLSRPVLSGSRQRPVDRRLQALEQLLALERPTTKALAYRDWPLGVGPRVHYEEPGQDDGRTSGATPATPRAENGGSN